MPVHRVRWLALLAGVAWTTGACGGGETERPLGPALGSSTSSGAGAGGAGGGGGGSGGGTVTGAGGSGGDGGGGAPAECGNGVAEPGEPCDGSDLGSSSCQSLGFDTGTLSCTPGCAADTSGCSGTETCFDGKDNDGDTLRDCNDPECAAACADSCGAGPTVPDPTVVDGDTTGHAALLDPSCESPGASGPEVVYHVTAAQTGTLDVALVSSANLGISVRTICDVAASELVCSEKNVGPNASEILGVPVTAGQSLAVIVDGYQAGDFGAFTISIKSHAVVCGDGISDPGEACDDANTTSGDGCSAQCVLEPTESEQNGEPALADAFAAPWTAEIAPAGDVDVVAISVPGPSSTLTADTYDLGDGACSLLELDAYLEILDTDGVTVLAEDDDSGDGYCAHTSAAGLGAGTYYVRVKASPADPSVTFPYHLSLVVQ